MVARQLDGPVLKLRSHYLGVLGNLQNSPDVRGVCVWVCMCVCSVMSNCLQPHGLYSLPTSSVHGIIQARILEIQSLSTFTNGDSTSFSGDVKIKGDDWCWWCIWPGSTLNGFPINVSFSSYAIVKDTESISHSVLSDCVTAWTVAHQAPLSMEF